LFYYVNVTLIYFRWVKEKEGISKNTRSLSRQVALESDGRELMKFFFIRGVFSNIIFEALQRKSDDNDGYIIGI
jgi:hypothetical protein